MGLFNRTSRHPTEEEVVHAADELTKGCCSPARRLVRESGTSRDTTIWRIKSAAGQFDKEG
ncbi:hypothetical protein ACFCWG_24825 [Streptomyces sp. NPDC056390]|uniref:hypothetical protein n=1 Tax=Streptomyces sp. NPDC056390 TaxID=3345806 RepID=UPI0035DA43BD